MVQAYQIFSAITAILSTTAIDAFSSSSSSQRTRTTVTSTFVPQNNNNYGVYSPSHKMTALYLSSQGHDYYDDEEDDDSIEDYGINNRFFDVDSAREQLESLVGAASAGSLEGQISQDDNTQQPSSSQHRRSALHNIRLLKDDLPENNFKATGGASIASSPSMLDVLEPPPLSVDLPHRPPLTSIERERRMAELKVLKSLRDNPENDDEAIADLWSLWFAERGAQAENILKEADELMDGHVRQQLEAEKLLRSLIEEYGVYFAEPVNRLATLYFQQGRMEESLALNKIVLAVKPWHVGALSHIVTVYEAMGDSMSARSWARFRLPSGSSNKRRDRWVERAISDAIRKLEQGEMNNSMSFGESDSSWIQKQPTAQVQQDDDDAWQ